MYYVLFKSPPPSSPPKSLFFFFPFLLPFSLSDSCIPLPLSPPNLPMFYSQKTNKTKKSTEYIYLDTGLRRYDNPDDRGVA